MELEEIMEAAREASRNAYAPYSGFHVGAAIMTEGGSVHTGCNVENASYGLAICAERNAAAAMALADLDDRSIRLVAVHSPGAAPCFPCGACRQVLREFGCKEVVVEDGSGGFRRLPFERDILPNSFGPEAL
ncbi:MAG: cytidine deaminase [Rubrobacter sp.]|nr:cytidine deaminase [Rubrobacter sp.]